MGGFFCILKRELRGYLVVPMTYLLLNSFIVLSGFIFFSLLRNFNKALHEYAGMAASVGKPPPTLNGFVAEGMGQSLVLLCVLIVPLLAMRLFSDERKGGIEELLFASPLSSTQLVFGKFFALAILMLVTLGATALFPILLVIFGNPEVAPLLSGFLGTALIALFFLAAGLLCSSLVDSHATAGILCFVVLLLMYMSNSYFDAWDSAHSSLWLCLSPLWQVTEFIKGVVSLGGIAYFVLGTLTFLCLAISAVEMRRA
jgi:ABC-2 type transport system permease protein